MKFLKTVDGYIPDRSIIRISKNTEDEWCVYWHSTNLAGSAHVSCTEVDPEDLAAFLNIPEWGAL